MTKKSKQLIADYGFALYAEVEDPDGEGKRAATLTAYDALKARIEELEKEKMQ